MATTQTTDAPTKLATVLAQLAPSKTVASKAASALLLEQGAALDEAGRHVSDMTVEIDQHRALVAKLGELGGQALIDYANHSLVAIADGTQPPPITPPVAFDILSERINNALLASSFAATVSVEQWDGMTKHEVGCYVRTSISQKILAQAKPVVIART